MSRPLTCFIAGLANDGLDIGRRVLEETTKNMRNSCCPIMAPIRAQKSLN